MNSTFSGHFGYRRLLRVTLPSIVMMIFTSIYCVTDGFFVSNFASLSAAHERFSDKIVTL